MVFRIWRSTVSTNNGTLQGYRFGNFNEALTSVSDYMFTTVLPGKLPEGIENFMPF